MKNSITGIPNISQLSPEKQELLALERTGIYVFHGSGEDLASLNPRQAVDDSTGPDGPPAVFASNLVEFAIFMAIMNRHNYSSGTISAGTRGDGMGKIELEFAVTRDIWDELKDTASGWVYVFNKSDFTPRTEKNAEFVSHESVVPVKKIKVSKRDLPANIAIRES